MWRNDSFTPIIGLPPEYVKASPLGAPYLLRVGKNHAHKGENRTDGEVNASIDDHIGHSHSNDGDYGGLPQDVEQVYHRQKPRRKQAGHNYKYDQPAPYADRLPWYLAEK